MNLRTPPDSYYEDPACWDDPTAEYDENGEPVLVEADPDQAWKERDER